VYDGQAEVGVALTVDELVVDEVQSAQGSELVVVVVVVVKGVARHRHILAFWQSRDIGAGVSVLVKAGAVF